MRLSVRVAALVVLGLAAACNGTWRPSASCARTGSSCAEHGDCCSFACIGGSCECADVGVHCLVDTACCAGLVCQDEMCVPGCRADGAACDTDRDCCSGGCNAGTCGTPMCHAEADACMQPSDCCAGLACISGLRARAPRRIVVHEHAVLLGPRVLAGDVRARLWRPEPCMHVRHGLLPRIRLPHRRVHGLQDRPELVHRSVGVLRRPDLPGRNLQVLHARQHLRR